MPWEAVGGTASPLVMPITHGIVRCASRRSARRCRPAPLAYTHTAPPWCPSPARRSPQTCRRSAVRAARGPPDAFVGGLVSAAVAGAAGTSPQNARVNASDTQRCGGMWMAGRGELEAPWPPDRAISGAAVVVVSRRCYAGTQQLRVREDSGQGWQL
eukprot:364804-Chlamydomonas_euryale.AAC.12